MDRDTIMHWSGEELSYWVNTHFGQRSFGSEFDRLNLKYPTLFVLDIAAAGATLLPKPGLVDDLGNILGDTQAAVRIGLYKACIAEAVRLHAPNLQTRIAIDVHDIPLAQGDAPIFCFQKVVGSRNILLPDIDFMHHDWYRAALPDTDQGPKQLTAIFAGASTGGGIQTSDAIYHDRSERLRLASAFVGSKTTIFKIGDAAQCSDPEAEELLRAKPYFSAHVTWQDQLRHQFVVSVDGNGATCSRVINTLRSHSVLVKFTSPNLLFYFRGMKPWKHYIPVDSPSDVERLIADAERGMINVTGIAKAARTFFDEHLTRDAINAYVAELLTQYAQNVMASPPTHCDNTDHLPQTALSDWRSSFPAIETRDSSPLDYQEDNRVFQRPDIIQRLLDQFDAPSYLEVGVNHGITFHAVEAPRKVAVDPSFNFDVAAAMAAGSSGSVTYNEVTSDAFFDDIGEERFDVIYLDGLHTFDQTLRDLLNAIGALADGGFVIIDDTIPSSYGASLPTMEDLFRFREAINIVEHAWMGDVFRLVFFIRDYLPAFSYATVKETHGQTIVWRCRRSTPSSPRNVSAVANLDYANAMIGISEMNVLPMAEIEALIRDGHSSPSV